MLTAPPVPQEAPLSDDRALVALARDGDTRAFTELLHRHDDKMRGVVWRLVESRDEMDDILQDAYVKAWRGLGDFRGDAAFSSWLYRIVYTTSLDAIKRSARRRVVPLDEVAGDRNLVTDDAGSRVADSHALRDALAELPEDQLAVVALVDGQGESYDDVAELLGISPGTVGSRLSRARAQLRRHLRGESSPGRNEGQGGRS